MAEDSDLERTEPASGRKIQKARDEGNVPRSRELSTFAVLIATGSALALMSSFLIETLRRMVHDSLSFGRADIASPTMMGNTLSLAAYDAMLTLLPIGAVVVLAALIANVIISGWNFSLKPLQADLGKMNPLKGLGRMFGWKSLVELGKAALKGGVIAGASVWMIWLQWDEILTLSAEPLESAMPHFGWITMYTFLAAAAAFALIAAIDVPYQIWNYHHGLRMTKEEVRQEHKETEGDPQVKARIRALQREQARRRMMQAVPRADVVVTNPMHFAVALKYEEKGAAVPVVIAKGSQLVAERIKEIAREHHVPIVEAPPLARALHRHVEVGEVIPGTLFSAVAQVLAYVYQLNNQMNPALPEAWQVPAELDPANRPTA
ncbi:MAG: flagellar biosynthesis protein FlhB [Gallionellaceae bacterium]|nr:flagellar biosynthesis protein FlhB [Gallionellaceae bacterium]MDD5364509.1 flagellar biosynthesis protein FlhB [Gallionellaceae bacterium]